MEKRLKKSSKKLNKTINPAITKTVSKITQEENTAHNHGGLPDIPMNKFLGCGT